MCARLPDKTARARAARFLSIRMQSCSLASKYRRYTTALYAEHSTTALHRNFAIRRRTKNVEPPMRRFIAVVFLYLYIEFKSGKKSKGRETMQQESRSFTEIRTKLARRKKIVETAESRCRKITMVEIFFGARSPRHSFRLIGFKMNARFITKINANLGEKTLDGAPDLCIAPMRTCESPRVAL